LDCAEFCLKTNDYDIPCKLFWAEGNVEIVVIGVHGFAGDKDSSVLAALAEQICRVQGALICFDFPAHGKSEAADEYLRIGNCKRDLLCVAEYVREMFPGKKYGIFATSFGAYVTLLCSERLKDFEKVLRAPAVTMASSFAEKILPVSKEEFLKNGGAVCGYERKIFVSTAFYADLLGETVTMPEQALMIIHGTQDDIIPYEAVKALAGDNVQIKLITVEGADHRFKRPGDLSVIIEESMQWLLNAKQNT